MFTVLILASFEKLINLALSSDAITRTGLKPLSGKVLRLVMQTPQFSIDVLFNDDHIRLEPVTTSRESVFEPKGFESNTPKTPVDANNTRDDSRSFEWQSQAKIGHSLPDCIIKVANIADLLNLMRAPEGNLPIEGDYKVLMQFKQLIAGFSPDIAGQLEPIIGVVFASQLRLLINQLKGNMATTAKHTFNDVADWVDEVAGNAAPDPELEAQSNDLKQQLLKLRADVQREEARLAMIKAEQARLKGQS